jgi:very-short-patch-repair endonuclease
MPRPLDAAALDRLTRLLAHQAGVVSRRQVLGLGLPDSLIRTRLATGRWQPGHPATYVGHNGPISYESWLWSAFLYAGPGAAISHTSAAFVHRLRSEPPREVHVSVPSSRRIRGQSHLVVHLRSPMPATTRAELTITKPADTVLDVAGSLHDPDDVVALVTRAIGDRRVTPGALRKALAARPRIANRALVEELVDIASGGVESVLEWRYLRDVERAHRLPTAQRQMVMRGGGQLARVDVWYAEYRVIVELDGRAFHSGARADRDMRRDNESATSGQLTLRYGWYDTAWRPCEVALQVSSVLRSRGWAGRPTPCRSCRHDVRILGS